MKILKEIIKELLCTIAYFIESNMYSTAVIIEIANPYLMLYIGYILCKTRGTYEVGGEIFMPILIFILVALLKKFANKRNKGMDVPLPFKIFTEDIGDGEIVMNQDDVQDMILYMHDLENYFKKTGKLK